MERSQFSWKQKKYWQVSQLCFGQFWHIKLCLLLAAEFLFCEEFYNPMLNVSVFWMRIVSPHVWGRVNMLTPLFVATSVASVEKWLSWVSRISERLSLILFEHPMYCFMTSTCSSPFIQPVFIANHTVPGGASFIMGCLKCTHRNTIARGNNVLLALICRKWWPGHLVLHWQPENLLDTCMC
jgi:hypothetical protein